MRRIKLSSLVLSVCLAGAWVAWTLPARADDTVPTETESQRLDRLEKENSELQKRLDALEGTVATNAAATAAPVAAPATSVAGIQAKTLEFLSKVSISGHVDGSYFYDFNRPESRTSDGLTFTRNANSFTLNQAQLTLQKPVVNNGTDWDAGFRLDLVWGSDAPILNNGPDAGFNGLRQAYAEFNVPVGNGLDVKAGQLISLLNYESGDVTLNPNFSQGNQWYFTGNGPGAGVQAGYAFNDKVDAQVRVQNGLFAGAVDNNSEKTMIGRLGFKPDSKTSIAVFGFGGVEGETGGAWLRGTSLIAQRAITEKMGVATEWDYFYVDTSPGSADWWSGGGWAWYNFTKIIGVAARGDFIHDPDGAGTSGLLGFPANDGGMDLTSLTLTLNITPTPNLQIRPEIRYDHTSLPDGLNGHDSRVSAGMGLGYLF